MPVSALQEFAEDVRQDLVEQQRAGVFGIFDLTMIMGLITAIVQAVQLCKGRTPTPSPSPTSVTESEGEQLHEIASKAWNPEQGEYDGWDYTHAVKVAKKKSDEQTNRRRKADAVKHVTAIFNRARRSTPERLEAIAACITSSTSS